MPPREESRQKAPSGAFLFLGVCLIMGMSHDFKKNDGWIDLFNGKNLDGWIVKIAKHETGENYGETF